MTKTAEAQNTTTKTAEAKNMMECKQKKKYNGTEVEAKNLMRKCAEYDDNDSRGAEYDDNDSRAKEQDGNESSGAELWRQSCDCSS